MSLTSQPTQAKLFRRVICKPSYLQVELQALAFAELPQLIDDGCGVCGALEELISTAPTPSSGYQCTLATKRKLCIMTKVLRCGWPVSRHMVGVLYGYAMGLCNTQMYGVLRSSFLLHVWCAREGISSDVLLLTLMDSLQ